MSDHYKTLISDDEVIRELIRESKRREGKLPTQSSRLKPNLNFFQRTVNRLVSNNDRINKEIDTFKEDFLKNPKIRKLKRPFSLETEPPPINYKYERHLILQKRINFVKSQDNDNNVMYGTSSTVETFSSPNNETKPSKYHSNYISGLSSSSSNAIDINSSSSSDSNESDSSDSDVICLGPVKRNGVNRGKHVQSKLRSQKKTVNVDWYL